MMIINNCQHQQPFQHRGQKEIRHKIAYLQGSLMEDSAKSYFYVLENYFVAGSDVG